MRVRQDSGVLVSECDKQSLHDFAQLLRNSARMLPSLCRFANCLRPIYIDIRQRNVAAINYGLYSLKIQLGTELVMGGSGPPPFARFVPSSPAISRVSAGITQNIVGLKVLRSKTRRSVYGH